jgi:hypothetical protein
MNLPLVDIFPSPYDASKTRNGTLEEVLAVENPHLRVNNRLKAYVANANEAAQYIAALGADNDLGNFINNALDNSVAYKSWQQAMPSKTPNELSRYQRYYPKCDFAEVSAAIKAVGHLPSEGQYLFHAGLWPGVSCLITDRPFSTSFCPQVALRNADHKGKGYESDRIDLFVLRVINPKTKVFAYKRKGTNLGHENEVVFATGAELSLRSLASVNNDYPAGKYGCPDKRISVYVLAVDIS